MDMDAERWVHANFRAFERNFEKVLKRLENGHLVKLKQLRRALYFVRWDFRDNDLKILCQHLLQKGEEGARLLRQGLSAAHRTGWALGNWRLAGQPTWPLHLTSPTNTSATKDSDQQQWDDLWGRFELLLKYSEKLEEKLIAIVSPDSLANGLAVDDECVFLAHVTVLYLRAVKSKFLVTYDRVPWEDMEFILVSFIEAHTRYFALAFIVVTAERTLAHLRTFRTRLFDIKQDYFLKEASKIKEWEGEPKGSGREEFLSTLLKSTDLSDKALATLCCDCIAMRDFQSLRDIKEALQAAIESLQLSDKVWRQCGYLALQGALVMVGERLKNSWTSPNLSARSVELIRLISTDRVRNALRDIRDYIAHPASDRDIAEPSTEADRKILLRELENVLGSVRYLLIEAQNFLVHEYWREGAGLDRNRAAVSLLHDKEILQKSPFFDEVLRLLKSDVVREDLDDKKMETALEIVRQERDQDKVSQSRNAESTVRYVAYGVDRLYSPDLRCEFTLRHPLMHHCLLATMPSTVDRAICFHLLRLARNTDKMSSLGMQAKTTARKGAKRPSKDQFDQALKGLSALRALQSGTMPDSTMKYAIRGGLRIVASYWHEKDKLQPSTSFSLPVLVGRQLRNYLNHLDKFIGVCYDPGTELTNLWKGLTETVTTSNVDLGTQPAAMSLQEAEAENARLLGLVQLKCELFRCARSGDMDGMHRAARGGADVRGVDLQRRTVVFVAAEAGHVAVVERLLQLPRPLFPFLGDWVNRNPLHVVRTADIAKALLGAWEKVELYPQSNFSPERGLDDLHMTPLHLAAWDGRTEVVRLLIADPSNARSFPGFKTPLAYAVWGGHEETVRLILADENKDHLVLAEGPRFVDTDENKDPLVLAARCGSPLVLNAILDDSRDLCSDDRCRSALRNAALFGRKDCVAILLDRLKQRTSSQQRDDLLLDILEVTQREVFIVLLQECSKKILRKVGSRLLYQAATAGAEDAVSFLINKQHINAASRTSESLSARETFWVSPLHGAIHGGFMRIVKMLIAKIPMGHSLRTGRGEQMPPLHAAAEYGRLDTVKLLIEEGADVNVRTASDDNPDVAWWTALHEAASSGHGHVFKWLLQNTPVQFFDSQNGSWTPLQVAVYYDQLEMVKTLLTLDRPDLLDLLEYTDRDGGTALGVAVIADSLDMVEYLLRRENELLKELYKKKKNNLKKGVAFWDKCCVYRTDENGRTELDVAVHGSADVALALLRYSTDNVFMKMAGKEVADVVSMARDTVKRAALRTHFLKPSAGIQTIIEWIKEKEVAGAQRAS